MTNDGNSGAGRLLMWLIVLGMLIGGCASWAFGAPPPAAARASATDPDRSLTPGLARALSRQSVCTVKWGKDERHVTPAMKQQVFKAYGIDYATHAQYEVDHLISRELAGADDVTNLWPEPYTGH